MTFNSLEKPKQDITKNDFLKLINNDLIDYAEFISRQQFRMNERQGVILQIPQKMKKNIQQLKKELSSLQSNFMKTKVCEAFFESAPQFILQVN